VYSYGRIFRLTVHGAARRVLPYSGWFFFFLSFFFFFSFFFSFFPFSNYFSIRFSIIVHVRVFFLRLWLCIFVLCFGFCFFFFFSFVFFLFIFFFFFFFLSLVYHFFSCLISPIADYTVASIRRGRIVDTREQSDRINPGPAEV